MSSTVSFVDPHESLESVLARSPEENLKTPEKKTVPILPLKRTFSHDEDNKENEAPEDDEDEQREDRLDPRKLDIEARVLFGDEEDVKGDEAVEPVSSDEDEEEGETVDATQHETVDMDASPSPAIKSEDA